jgi:hypothetical protein
MTTTTTTREEAPTAGEVTAAEVMQPFIIIADRLADLERRLSELEAEKKKEEEKK